jgi:excisionase family DNA binding protein
MDSIIQIHNVTRKEFVSIIEKVIEDRLTTFLKTKEPENMTVQETAKLLGVSELTIHNYIKRALIPASKIGRRIVIKRIDVEAALSEVKSLKYKR